MGLLSYFRFLTENKIKKVIEYNGKMFGYLVLNVVYLMLHPLIFLPSPLLKAHQQVSSPITSLFELFSTRHYKVIALIVFLYFNSKCVMTKIVTQVQCHYIMQAAQKMHRMSFSIKAEYKLSRPVFYIFILLT